MQQQMQQRSPLVSRAFRPHKAAHHAGSRVQVKCVASAATGQGTPVSKNSILVVGATGTVGRQVVRRALDEGYDVRCMVRPRQTPADFLRDWGATTVQAMGIQRYIFFSIYGCDKHPEVPLMNIKSCTEEFLRSSGLNYTIFRPCGFMQAVIGNYAVPVLEDKSVWGTSDETRTAYLDSVDVARMTLAALRSEQSIGKTITLAGPKAWSTADVIKLCERLAGTRAKVNTVPTWLLRSTRSTLRGLQWAWDASDRLAFAEVLASNETWDAPMAETYSMLDIDPASVTSLDTYLQDYFSKVLKKLKEVEAAVDRTNFYL